MSSLIKKSWLKTFDQKALSVLKSHSDLRTRFAPSPSGYLHLGHALHLIYLWSLSHLYQATIELRSEDHDTLRSRPEFLEAIKDDLFALNFLPSALAKEPFHTQMGDPSRYQDAIAQLTRQGLCYACSCSRPAIRERAKLSSGIKGEIAYDGHCRNRNLSFAKEKTCLRLLVEDGFGARFYDLWQGEITQSPHEQCGDFILIDKFGNFSYQLANVLDDDKAGINFIIRGLDILDSTGRQVYLRKKLGIEKQNIVYAHHPLLLEEDGSEKLSKRQRSESLLSWREQGKSAEEILALALKKAGLAEEALEKVTLNEIIACAL